MVSFHAAIYTTLLEQSATNWWMNLQLNSWVPSVNYNEILFIDNVDHNDFNEHPLALKNVNYINMKHCLALINECVHANILNEYTKK